MLLPTAGFTSLWSVPACRPPELAVTPEFRPGQCPEVTLLSGLISTASKSHTQEKDTGRCRNAELPSSTAHSKVTGVQSRQRDGVTGEKRQGDTNQ